MPVLAMAERNPPGRIRTCGLNPSKGALYPLSYRGTCTGYDIADSLATSERSPPSRPSHPSQRLSRSGTACAIFPDMDTDSLRVDLADMDDVRAQLPRACDILKRKRDALALCQSDYDSFRELVELLAKRAGVPFDEGDGDDDASATGTQTPSRGDVLSLVVEVVGRENRPIRARDVQRVLRAEGHELVGDSVRDALYYAAKRREPPLIQSLPDRGYYAPLSYRRDQDAMFSNGDGPSVSASVPAASGSGP
jgi:hypothetical protein